jgi:hypothetical protein
MITKIVITTAPIFVKCSKYRLHVGISVGGSKGHERRFKEVQSSNLEN